MTVGVSVIVGGTVGVSVGAGGVAVKIAVAVCVGPGVLVGLGVGVVGVMRLLGRSMRGETQRGLSASAEPLARTAKINLTFLPASALKSRSTV